MSRYVAIATINYFTLLLGLSFLKKSRKLHALTMSLAIASDFTLVFILEFTRNVIAETTSPKLSLLNHLHIASSLLAALLYIPIMFLGWRLLFRAETSQALKPIHQKLGYAAIGFRTIGFLLMFSMHDLHL